MLWAKQCWGSIFIRKRWWNFILKTISVFLLLSPTNWIGSFEMVATDLSTNEEMSITLESMLNLKKKKSSNVLFSPEASRTPSGRDQKSCFWCLREETAWNIWGNLQELIDYCLRSNSCLFCFYEVWKCELLCAVYFFKVIVKYVNWIVVLSDWLGDCCTMQMKWKRVVK